MDRAVVFSVGFCILVVLVVPSVLVRGCDLGFGSEPAEEAAGPNIKVFVDGPGSIVEMPLDDYVEGVVAAEMPASFGTEALKAQAVAARTFAVKRMRQFGGPGCAAHPGADVCTDHLHCQAWVSEDELRKKLSYLEYYAYSRKIASAVESTTGKVVTYHGEPIEAYYHAASGGSTEDSEDAWHAVVPYLRAVATEFEAREPSLAQRIELTFSDLQKKLGVKLTERKVRTYKVAGRDVQVVAEERMDRPIEVLKASQSGRVREIRIGDRVFSGQSLREILGLRSTKLTFQIVGNSVHFMTTGYGHGVGMSQYGAEVMAEAGKSYIDILKHYYTGTEVTMFEGLAAK